MTQGQAKPLEANCPPPSFAVGLNTWSCLQWYLGGGGSARGRLSEGWSCGIEVRLPKPT